MAMCSFAFRASHQSLLVRSEKLQNAAQKVQKISVHTHPNRIYVCDMPLKACLKARHALLHAVTAVRQQLHTVRTSHMAANNSGAEKNKVSLFAAGAVI